MEISVLSRDKENLFDRERLEFTVSYDGSTPSNKRVKENLCKKLNLKPDLTVITEIDQQFGLKQCRACAHAYSSEDSMKRYESEHLLKRIDKRSAKGQEAQKEGATDAKKEDKPEDKKEVKEQGKE